MQAHQPIPTTEMVRIPGLFRRWELPEVLKNHHAFHIEDAGAHQDGTPLLAIYAASEGDPQVADDDVPDRGAGSLSRPTGAVSRPPE